jgi:hypothetical protein
MTYTHTVNAADHPVKSVTIFKSSTAEVIRTFALDFKVCLLQLDLYLVARLTPLQPGENRVEIKGLSSVIDTESARVSGLEDSLRLFDVVCTVKPPAYLDPDDIEEVIRHLEKEKQTLLSEKRSVRHPYATIQVLTRNAAQGAPA